MFSKGILSSCFFRIRKCYSWTISHEHFHFVVFSDERSIPGGAGVGAVLRQLWKQQRAADGSRSALPSQMTCLHSTGVDSSASITQFRWFNCPCDSQSWSWRCLRKSDQQTMFHSSVETVTRARMCFGKKTVIKPMPFNWNILDHRISRFTDPCRCLKAWSWSRPCGGTKSRWWWTRWMAGTTPVTARTDSTSTTPLFSSKWKQKRSSWRKCPRKKVKFRGDECAIRAFEGWFGSTSSAAPPGFIQCSAPNYTGPFYCSWSRAATRSNAAVFLLNATRWDPYSSFLSAPASPIQ